MPIIRKAQKRKTGMGEGQRLRGDLKRLNPPCPPFFKVGNFLGLSTVNGNLFPFSTGLKGSIPFNIRRTIPEGSISDPENFTLGIIFIQPENKTSPREIG